MNKDYLHLYLGCECVMEISSYHAVHELHLSKKVPFVLTGKLLHYFSDTTTKAVIKPILRPLQYAEKDEIEHIIWLVNDSAVHLDDDSRISKEEASNSIDVIEPDDNAIVVYFTIRCFEGKLYLSNHSGLLRMYDEEDKEQPIEFKPELFRYLLSKRFDLFGLIDAGLAINKTQIEAKE